MTLPASGSISLQQICTEFGLAFDSVWPTAFYGLDGAPGSGALSFQDFYGRSNVTPPAITADNTAPTVYGYNQSASSLIDCDTGKTISSITLIAGAANARITPGSTGGNSTTGTVSSPASGLSVVQATYRYTCNTGEFVDVEYYGEWGT